MPSSRDTRELRSYRISPRVVLYRGDHLRLGSGPTHRGRRIGLRGVFELLRILRLENRIWFECRQIVDDGVGGTHCIFVSGAPFERTDLPGVLMQPYRVRRLKRRPKEKQLLLFDT